MAHLCRLIGELICLSRNAREVSSPPVPQPSVRLGGVTNVVSNLESKLADVAQSAVLPTAHFSLKPEYVNQRDK